MSLHRSYTAGKAGSPIPTYSSHEPHYTKVPIASRSWQTSQPSTKDHSVGLKSTISARTERDSLSPASSNRFMAKGGLEMGAQSGKLDDTSSSLPPSTRRQSTAPPNTVSSSTQPSTSSGTSGISRIPIPSSLARENSPALDSSRKVIRRKPPSVQQFVSGLTRSASENKTRGGATNEAVTKRNSKSLREVSRRHDPGAALSAGTPEQPRSTMDPQKRSGGLPPALIPELQALAAATAANKAAASTPHVPLVSSPSTQYSGSAGPWSSRDTTPTSVSSCSPGIVQPSRVKPASRLRSAVSPYTASQTPGPSQAGPPAVVDTPRSQIVNRQATNYDDRHQSLQQHRETGKGPSVTLTPPTTPPRKSSIRSQSGQQRLRAQEQASKEALSSLIIHAKHSGSETANETQEITNSAELSSPRGAPRRPSRKGTAELASASSPIVQSNLSPQTLRGYQERGSLDGGYAGIIANEPGVKDGGSMNLQKKSLPFSQPRRAPTEEAPQLSKTPLTTRTSTLQKRSLASKEGSGRRGTNETGRSTLEKLSSRLGIFGRRTKSSRQETSTKEERELRKGPTAGTGHEGYGKYARRGRRYSVGSGKNNRDWSTSAAGTTARPPLGQRNSQSSGAGSEIDEFVAQRLQPVVITGGGRPDPRPESDAPTVWPSFPRASVDSGSSLDLVRQLTNATSISFASDSRSISVTSVGTDAPSLTSTQLRSVYPSGPNPNPTYAPRSQPSLDGYSTSQSSILQDDSTTPYSDRRLSRPTLRDMKKAGKKGRLFRWNPFQRKAGTEDAARRIEQRVPQNPRMSVAVAPVSIDKPIPYYALMDSENENEEETSLQDLLQQVSESTVALSQTGLSHHGLGLRHQYGQSILLPSMPVLQRELPRDTGASFANERNEAPAVNLRWDVSPQSPDTKPNRLPQVGRIPRVISRRDRQHKPAPTSFSRPFHRENLLENTNVPNSHPAWVFEKDRPVLGIQTDVLPSRPFSSPESGKASSAPAGPLGTRPRRDYNTNPGYVVFTGPEGQGAPRLSGSGFNPSANYLPTAARDRRHVEEDEIWNEYDDLLDHVMSPGGETPRPAMLGQDPVLHIVPDANMAGARPESHLTQGVLGKIRPDKHQYQAPSLRLPTLSSVAPDADYRLRRSRIVSALQSHSPLSPSSPFSIGDYAGGYEDKRRSKRVSSERFGSAPAAEVSLSSSSARSSQPRFPTISESSHHQSTALLDIAERDQEGPAGQSDLRFAALMTSRWLSFGRVLFSPAHEAVTAKANQKVLVIDGLGNDDWSFYCAVTYPNAVIYDIKETDIKTRRQAEPPKEKWRAPNNYQRIELPSLAEPFPFPPSHFAVVVFRFPPAMSDAILKAAIAESRRVLIPGGHIELSLLDLDMVNMGSVTRHVVRDLKARMIEVDAEVSLKPASDNVQDILGEKGFDNLNRCVLSVPVAGEVATSSGSWSSRSSRDSYNQKGKDNEQVGGKSAGRARRSHDSGRDQPQGGNFSLSELVFDHSAKGDQKISRMVAKVGRWWYTRTYEWAVLAGGDLKRSIWKDKKMLHECKVRGSGFKLLIAYAQKPVETRRRTMSEPINSTAAISGTRVMNRSGAAYRTGQKRQ